MNWGTANAAAASEDDTAAQSRAAHSLDGFPLLLAALKERGESLSCAESLTGGLLAARLTDVPGASAVFVGGVVSYATRIKRELLAVSAANVISAECAAQMAVGVKTKLGSDWALSTTGVAGPDRQEDQPVGTVFVGVAGPKGVTTKRLALTGNRHDIRAGCVVEAGAALLELLREER